MKIRSITSFFRSNQKSDSSTLAFLESMSTDLKSKLEREGFPVQTIRLATTPFSEMNRKPASLLAYLLDLEEQAILNNFQYLSVGSVAVEDQDNVELILPILEQGKNTFVTAKMLTGKGEVSLKAIRSCAKIIATAAGITPDGFTNLRFAAIANVAPFCPFFPAGYSQGASPGFALALEGADLALDVFSNAKTLEEARHTLKNLMESKAKVISRICHSAENKFGIPFHGLDFSLAPFPDERVSIGKALESLGVASLGDHASVAAAAFLAGILDSGRWKKAGFNGLMLPVLEDITLASRSGNELQLKDLLLLSTVCGTGLDTIPLPGAMTAEMIAPILLDLAALSARLRKPLTARLMPLPGLSAGERTNFSFEYFSNGKVMQAAPQSLTGMLASDDIFYIPPRNPA